MEGSPEKSHGTLLSTERFQTTPLTLPSALLPTNDPEKPGLDLTPLFSFFVVNSPEKNSTERRSKPLRAWRRLDDLHHRDHKACRPTVPDKKGNAVSQRGRHLRRHLVCTSRGRRCQQIGNICYVMQEISQTTAGIMDIVMLKPPS